MRIAIDIDSTLHHYWDQFAAVIRERHGRHLPYEEQRAWSIEGLDPAHIRAAVLETHTEPFIAAAEPYPGAVETVNRWHAAGHFVHITSHRTTDAHEATLRWLREIGLRFDELYCSYDKISRCVAIGIHVLIDDSPVNLERAAVHGIVGATLRHPWNAEVLARVPGLIGADDWAGLAAALDPLLTGQTR